MSVSHSQTRRQLLLLATAAAPAVALGAWRRSRHGFFSAPDGIRWKGVGAIHDRLFLPLGMSFALQPGALTPDRRYLVYTALDRRTGSNIWTVPVLWNDGEPLAGMPAPYFHSGAFDTDPRFSRDGQRIAWASLAAGRWNLREREFPSG